MNVKRYITIINFAIVMFIVALLYYGNTVLFSLVYLATFLFVTFRAILSAGRIQSRFLLISTYFVAMALQVAFYILVVESRHPFSKVFAVILLLLPMVLSHYVTIGKNAELYLPTLQEAVTISFSQMHLFAGKITQTSDSLRKTGRSLSPANFRRLVDDLPNHDSFHYINAGSLTEDYFHAVEASLDDHSLYIIISNTGTPASDIISVFTRKQFNHASLSFDADMQTIVSYNGGERVYPPGLNREMIEFFNKKPDASILIYRLPVTGEQKRAAMDKIRQINEEGSAYNLLGLLTGKSYRSNIMYCSQFVYSLLRHIGATYFESPEIIKPTDLIEKDYFRKLEFVEELRFNAISDN